MSLAHPSKLFVSALCFASKTPQSTHCSNNDWGSFTLSGILHGRGSVSVCEISQSMSFPSHKSQNGWGMMLLLAHASQNWKVGTSNLSVLKTRKVQSWQPPFCFPILWCFQLSCHGISVSVPWDHYIYYNYIKYVHMHIYNIKHI